MAKPAKVDVTPRYDSDRSQRDGHPGNRVHTARHAVMRALAKLAVVPNEERGALVQGAEQHLRAALPHLEEALRLVDRHYRSTRGA